MNKVPQIITALREAHPGVVEEWERQRADGNEDWPGFETSADLAWWLDSEALVAGSWSRTDDAEHAAHERALQRFCLDALRYLLESGDA